MTPPIHKVIEQARKHKKMKQENLGPLVGCSRSYISKLENGETLPSLPLAEKLEKALGLEPGAIVSVILVLRKEEKKIKEQTKLKILYLRDNHAKKGPAKPDAG